MSLITSLKDQKKLRKAGSYLASVLEFAKGITKANLNLIELDQQIENKIIEFNCRPSFKGFKGFPNASCLSVNQQIVHSIPTDYLLKNGDILGIDIGLWLDNVCVDMAITIPIGETTDQVKKFLIQTKIALENSIKIIKPGIKVYNISREIEKVAIKNHYGIVKNLTGHGVGYKVHDEPLIPNYYLPSFNYVLKQDMVLAIEPMFALGRADNRTTTDGWGVETLDKSLASQFEHTVIVTEKGVEIITKKN